MKNEKKKNVEIIMKMKICVQIKKTIKTNLIMKMKIINVLINI